MYPPCDYFRLSLVAINGAGRDGERESYVSSHNSSDNVLSNAIILHSVDTCKNRLIHTGYITMFGRGLAAEVEGCRGGIDILLQCP